MGSCAVCSPVFVLVAVCVCVLSAAAVYDTESAGPKRSLGHAIAASPMRYHASFESAAQRFRKVGDVNDLTYDTDKGESLQMWVQGLAWMVAVRGLVGQGSVHGNCAPKLCLVCRPHARAENAVLARTLGHQPQHTHAHAHTARGNAASHGSRMVTCRGPMSALA